MPLRSACRHPSIRLGTTMTRDARSPRGALGSVRLLLHTALATDRFGLLMGMAMLVVSSLLRPLYPLLFKELIDAVTQNPVDLEFATWMAAAIALISAGAAGAGTY